MRKGEYFNIGANQLKEIPIAFNKSVATLIVKEVIVVKYSLITAFLLNPPLVAYRN